MKLYRKYVKNTSKLLQKNVMNSLELKFPLLLALCLMLGLSISCSEESLSPDINLNNETISAIVDDEAVTIVDKSIIPEATLKERMNYTDFYLTSIMETVLEVNPDFENIDEFKSSKDDGPAVYLDGLLNYATQKSNYDASAIKKGKELFEAFTDLEGQTWYPVLKRIRKGNGGAKKAIYLLKSFDEVLDKEYIKAYKLKKNGKLKLVHNKYTERLHKTSKANSSVYYVNLQNCAPGGGDIKKSNQKIAFADCSGSGGSGGSQGSTVLKIRKIKVFDKKETWLSPNQVHIFGYLVNMNKPDATYSGRFTHLRSGTPDFGFPKYKVTSFRSKDVKNGLVKNVSYNLAPNGHPGFTIYTLFEYDRFPAPIKSTRFTLPDGSTANIDFRSWNSKYVTTRLKTNNNVQYPNFPLSNGFGSRVTNNVIDYWHN